MAKKIRTRIKLPDGSVITRKTKREGDAQFPYGNWLWVVYDPSRRPSRKRVNLYTRDQSAAMTRAIDYARKYDLGTFDPWAQAAPQSGVTISEAAARYLRAKKRHASASTVETDRGHLDRLDRFLPAGSLVKHVEKRHVEDFLHRPKSNGEERSPSAKARTLATLKHFFRWANEQGLTPQDPAESIPPPKTRRERRDHITHEEEEAILRAISAAEVLSGEGRDWLRDWILFGVETGLRPGEQRELRWSDVDLSERMVRVRGTKTAGSRRTVPVAGRALAVLRRLAERRKSEEDGPVFTGAGGTPLNVAYASKQIQRFAREAGLEKNPTSYSLRHTYATRLVQHGVPLFDVARLMGTSVAMIEAHYGHYNPARGVAHVERVFGTNEEVTVRAPEP